MVILKRVGVFASVVVSVYFIYTSISAALCGTFLFFSAKDSGGEQNRLVQLSFHVHFTRKMCKMNHENVDLTDYGSAFLKKKLL